MRTSKAEFRRDDDADRVPGRHRASAGEGAASSGDAATARTARRSESSASATSAVSPAGGVSAAAGTSSAAGASAAGGASRRARLDNASHSTRPTGARRGEARRARTDAKLAEVVLAHLAAYGYAGLTIDRVSAQSGVAKTTIYRRWASKAEMVFDLAIQHAGSTPPPDTGSLAGDVRGLAQKSVALIDGESGRSVLPGLLTDMVHDEALCKRMCETFMSTARQQIEDVIDRAVARGEVDEGADIDGLHAALLGIPYVQIHLQARNDHQALVEQLTDQLLTLLGAHGS